MTPQETYILTHYTRIAETKQRGVRRMQAETAQTIMRGVISAVVNGLSISPCRGSSEDLDEA